MAIFADHLLVPSRTDCFTDVMWPVCASSSTPNTDLNSDETFFHMSCANGLDLVLPVPLLSFPFVSFLSFFFFVSFSFLTPTPFPTKFQDNRFASFFLFFPRVLSTPWLPSLLASRFSFSFRTSRATLVLVANRVCQGMTAAASRIANGLLFPSFFFFFFFFSTVNRAFFSFERIRYAAFRIIRRPIRLEGSWFRMWFLVVWLYLVENDSEIARKEFEAFLYRGFQTGEQGETIEILLFVGIRALRVAHDALLATRPRCGSLFNAFRDRIQDLENSYLSWQSTKRISSQKQIKLQFDRQIHPCIRRVWNSRIWIRIDRCKFVWFESKGQRIRTLYIWRKNWQETKGERLGSGQTI